MDQYADTASRGRHRGTHQPRRRHRRGTGENLPRVGIPFRGGAGEYGGHNDPETGYPVAHIKIAGFYRSLLPWDIAHNVKAAYWLALSGHRAEQIVKDFNPDMAIGTGGYVSGPVIRKAEQMGVPVFLHEQNAFPGVTTKMLAPMAETIFLAFPEAEKRIPGGKHFEVVGNPVRHAFIGIDKASARKALGIDDHFTIVSVGGSLGATAINKMAADLMAWHAPKGEINHFHGYGKNGRERFPKMLRERGLDLSKYPRIKAMEFIDQMHLYLAAADLVISRAGAITISELEAVGAPSILVPYPTPPRTTSTTTGWCSRTPGRRWWSRKRTIRRNG